MERGILSYTETILTKLATNGRTQIKSKENKP